MTSPQQQVDTKALEMAQRALDRVETHEKHCEERLERINGNLDRIHDGIEQLHGRVSNHKSNISEKVIYGLFAVCLALAGGLGSVVWWALS